jgi:hypothetical protein
MPRIVGSNPGTVQREDRLTDENVDEDVDED